MTTAIRLLAAIALAAAIAECALADGRAEKPKRVEKAREADGDDPTTPPSPTPKAGGSFTDDLEKLKTQLALTDQQHTKLREMRQARDQALERWDNANRRKIEAMNAQLAKTKNARARKAIESQLKAIDRGRAMLAANHERRMFAILKPDQKAKWNGPIFFDAVMGEFRSLNLSEKQEATIRKLCDARGRAQNAPVTAETHKSTINGLKRQVFQSVLTQKQRKAYARDKAPVRRADERRRARDSRRARRRED